MIDVSEMQTDRRGFLARTATGAALAALASLPAWVESDAQMPPPGPEVDKNRGWLRGVTTKYRQFFETPKVETFIPFHHIANYYGAWKATAGVRPNDMTAVLGITGFAVPVVFNDAMWSKYQFGKLINLTDASTGQPYTRNPFLNPQNGELFGNPEVAIPALQRMGARVILCNNAFGFVSAVSAQAAGSTPMAVRTELLANMTPGVTIVPAMVQAVEQAQRAGLTYMKNP